MIKNPVLIETEPQPKMPVEQIMKNQTSGVIVYKFISNNRARNLTTYKDILYKDDQIYITFSEFDKTVTRLYNITEL